MDDERHPPDDRYDPRALDDEFAREPERYRSRRSQPPRRSGQPPWAMIIGVGLLGILAAIMAVLVFGDRGTPGPTATASTPAGASASQVASQGPSASAAGASAAPSASAVATPTATPGPTPTPVSLQIDTIVASTVNNLSVRAAAGTGATRLGSLATGTQAYVASGPADADGYRWYLLSGLGLPPNTGCEGPLRTDPYNCPFWFGWVASGSNGVPWLVPAPAACPGPSFEFGDIVVGWTDLMRLSCFGSDPFTFRGWWPTLPDDPLPGAACVSEPNPTGWLICQQINLNSVTIGPDQGFGGLGLNVSIDPASGVTMPARGTWVELTVHLDDPAAQDCGTDAVGADAGDRTPEQIVLFCRGQMVVESVSAIAAP